MTRSTSILVPPLLVAPNWSIIIIPMQTHRATKSALCNVLYVPHVSYHFPLCSALTCWRHLYPSNIFNLIHQLEYDRSYPPFKYGLLQIWSFSRRTENIASSPSSRLFCFPLFSIIESRLSRSSATLHLFEENDIPEIIYVPTFPLFTEAVLTFITTTARTSSTSKWALQIRNLII